ncbi:LysR family transcriptional regulator [Crenobacter luteus]|uniref:LysR family transcriptional regulator n=1 Tax=Crenobacter luteus TaxID=1452487 RepID=A0A163DBT6_9NEIS|nr:LysR family transcriptional regulator [Crenobacter luteus]KZE34347.1 LysR family transcriptional regulator [Crenobacter luteus]
MDIRLLRYFSVLAEELHFGRAATRLHMSQPPLSQQIRQLEDVIGTPLFVRSHHRVELTAAGRTLKEQVSLVFTQLERAIDLTRQAGRGQLGELEIGMMSSTMVGILPDALRVFRERYPGVRWRLHELTPAAQLVALKERRIDVCVFRLGYDDPAVRNELLHHEPIRAALPAAHPLASRAAISPAELSGEALVTFALEQSRFANYLYQWCIQAGFTPRISQQVTEVQTLLSLVRTGFGIALLPASAEQLAPPGVVFRPLSPAMPEVPLFAVYRADDASPVLRLFLDTLRELVNHSERASHAARRVAASV